MPSYLEPSADIDALFAVAFGYHKAGDITAAEEAYHRILSLAPDHARTLHCLGVLNHQAGRSAAAAELIARAITCNDGVPEFHYNFGVVLEAMGRLDEAAEHYRRTISLNPNHANAHLNLGNVLLAQNKLENAEAASRRAMALNPASPDARYNLGVALARSHRFDDAITQFKQAVQIAPDHAAGTAYLGIAYVAVGDMDRGEQYCRQALALDPRNHQAAVHLGLICLERGELEEALQLALQAFETNDTPQARYLFSRAAHSAIATVENPRFRDLMVRALAERWERPSFLMRPAVSLIKLSPSVNAAIERQAAETSQLSAEPSARSDAEIIAIANEPVLAELLPITPVCDDELERVLTALRRGLLDLATRDASSQVPWQVPDRVLAFFCALAQQCFCNEYVYALADGEQERAEALGQSLDAAIAGRGDLPALWVAAVGAYLPLHLLRGAELLPNRPWPASVAAVVQQQIVEPKAQRELRASLPRLTAIEDLTSIKVKDQYEENPYPRWIVAGTTAPGGSFDTYLMTKFPHAGYKPLGKARIEILNAGCGTGQHAIETARKFVGCEMLAVDLSSASLAYALFKTRELGLTNIRCAVADILELAAIGRSFDFIEAVGSVQALATPAAGLRALVSLLNPGGVMMLGLYSKLGRTGVNAVRRYIAERHYRGTPSDIRRCRHELLAFPAGSLERSVTEFRDFYSMSECRDLLFHVQEYQHTLPEIKAFLTGEGLQFLGFAIDDPRLPRLYAEANPDDPAMIDLDAWHRFEIDHPDTFASMYQFYVQKI